MPYLRGDSMVEICSGRSPARPIKYVTDDDGCGVYIPRSILNQIGWNINDCIEFYVNINNREIVLVKHGHNPPHGNYQRVQNSRPSIKCPRDTFIIRPSPPNGGVIRIPKEIAGGLGIISQNGNCAYTNINPLVPTTVQIGNNWIYIKI